jgi:dihydrofolate synthase/folylpolyglutamate synthase
MASKTRKAGILPPITNYSTAMKHLMGQTNHEAVRIVKYNEDTFKLDRMRALMEAMGNPHLAVPAVHIAGTVGKGSTTVMTASMLRACGYTVGTYTSPHITEVCERIAIDGSPITRSDFTAGIAEIATLCHDLDLKVTYFELLTALAFQYFSQQAVDLMVLETGLGGRLDATNICVPEVAIITRIDLDHTNLLGTTVEEIAAEKAGIIKPGVPVLSFDQGDPINTVLRDRAEEVGADLKIINKDIEFSARFGVSPSSGPETRVCLITESRQFMHLPVPLKGEHQATNCGLALAAIDTLGNGRFTIAETDICAGLESTTIPGRMELVWSNPKILVDGAHNAASIKALVSSIGAHVPYDSMVFIFGCCADKDIPTMMEMAALGGDKIIFTKASKQPRAAEPEDLQKAFAEISGRMSQTAPNIKEALQIASRAVGRDDLICVTGSFYLVGDTKKYLASVAKNKS